MNSFNTQWMHMARQGNVRPIHYEGRDVHPIYRVTLAPGSKLVITRTAAKEHPTQGLRIKAAGKTMQLGGVKAKSFVTWCDTSPPRMELEVAARTATEMNIWNCWRDQNGDETDNFGNAGVVIEAEAETQAVTLRFSDGTGAPDFDCLVVKVELIRSP